MKRRITVNLDEDIVRLLHEMPGSASGAVNDAMRARVDEIAHRRALTAWIEALDSEHGAATVRQAAEVSAFLDDAFDVDPATRSAARSA